MEFMADNTAILQDYSHWDNFIRLWKLRARPDAPYLPEPWWGWHPASGEKLHSVVVNLCPGPGGKLQSQACISCASGCGISGLSYSAAMLCGVLCAHLADTERWHHRLRYRPLMLALGLPEEHISPDTRHHLSIELAPYHSDSALLNQDYLTKSKDDVVEHTLCFAARASRLIENDRLNRIVIVRAAYSKIRGVAGDRISEPQNVCREIGTDKISFDIFHLIDEKLSDVSFVCLSGAHNHLPSPKKLKEIIQYINIHQQTR